MSVLNRLSFLVAFMLLFFKTTAQDQYKILGALPIGSSQEDIDRFSTAVTHYKTTFTGTVDWALFHYQEIDVWKSQPWYKNSSIVLSITEVEFAYYYFYKYLTIEYIANINEYDWIWLMVSDCDYEIFDAQTFVDLLYLWNPGMAQPANTGFTIWLHTPLHNPSNVRVTNLVEIGPLLSIRPKLWELFRGLMNPEFNSGWGVDNILCTYVAKNHGYTLNPFNQTDPNADKPARIWLSAHHFTGKRREKRSRKRYRLCPNPLSFNPACLIVDASPLQHLDLHEGQKSGLYHNNNKNDVDWYREKYPEYFVLYGKEVSYCSMR